MFKIAPAPTFQSAAKVTVPGQAAPALLNIEWRHKGRAALRRWIDSLGGEDSISALMEVIAGWEGVGDDDGEPLPFCSDALAILLDAYPASGTELCRAYIEALTESRLGN